MLDNISSKFKRIDTKIEDKIIEIYVKIMYPTYELLQILTQVEFIVIVFLVCILLI